MADEVLQYQKLMQEEKIELNTLPVEIRNKIKALAPLIGRYNKTPTEALLNAITTSDISIADAIVDHLENGLPTEKELQYQLEADKKAKADADAKAKADSDADAKAKADAEAKVKADEDAKAKADADAKAKLEADEKAKLDASNAKEDEVKAIINSRSDKRIPTSDLARILGSNPSNPQTVGSIKLKQVYLNSAFYQLA